MKNKPLLFIALSLGLISAFLVYNYLSQAEAIPSVQMIDVVVASTRIPAHTRITASMLAWRKVPAQASHPDALHYLQDVQGKISNSEILAGEQILGGRLLPEGQVPGMSFTIPSGQRAITVAVNEVIGVAGFIKPGDQVDVLATFSEDLPLTTTVLENVTVLAIAQDMESKENPTAKLSTSVTLSLSPHQVERLVLAESQGAIRLALRPPQAVGMAGPQGTNITQIQPLGYRQEVPSQSQAAAPVSQPETSASPAIIGKKGTEITIIRGVNREVQVVYE